ncbi:MAG: 5'-nucleotidase C-terminal domain-containing protein [Acidobacteria bacterium]|nr:5'-nucleotidase C-terminal domain-containing protein [Acidobacteriota bacterium]MCA1627372.1 5'-nucleotidase C-terminal domain-containing protein [Acidobacteriota bacterium]
MKKRSPFFYSFMTLVLLLTLVFVARSFVPDRVQITILGTTDLHGNINPIDYYTNKPDNRGLAKIATLIKRVRREHPNVLLVDSGDTIQGSPLASFHSRKNNQPPNPMMLVMNSLNYDAMAVGNHEYNFGLKVLEKARAEANFPWLSANTYDVSKQQPHYKPYIVKEVAGVRIGILGLTTPGVPNWDNPPNYAGLEFHEPLVEARKWVPMLRDKEKADVVVIAMHMGLGEDLRTGEVSPGQVRHENQAITIAKEVPGVDVIFMGHTHRDVPSLYLNGVLLTQANHWGRHLARADVYLQKSDTGWRVYAKSARTLPVDDRVEADPDVVKLAEPYDNETQGWLAKVIGQSAEELTAKEARFRDTAILDLIQKVQLEAGKADVSMVASFNSEARIAKGPVSVRDIAGLYVYENTLVVLEVTGQQLKDALEHSAKYFKTYVPGKAPADLIDEKIPAYNFDIAEGVTYELDLSKPVGQRIQNLRFRNQPLSPTRKLRLATNNYRVNGGGGYTMYKNAPVVYRSSEEIRELIIDWLERNKTVPVKPNNNWRLVP